MDVLGDIFEGPNDLCAEGEMEALLRDLYRQSLYFRSLHVKEPLVDLVTKVLINMAVAAAIAVIVPVAANATVEAEMQLSVGA